MHKSMINPILTHLSPKITSFDNFFWTSGQFEYGKKTKISTILTIYQLKKCKKTLHFRMCGERGFISTHYGQFCPEIYIFLILEQKIKKINLFFFKIFEEKNIEDPCIRTEKAKFWSILVKTGHFILISPKSETYSVLDKNMKSLHFGHFGRSFRLKWCKLSKKALETFFLTFWTITN